MEKGKGEDEEGDRGQREGGGKEDALTHSLVPVIRYSLSTASPGVGSTHTQRQQGQGKGGTDTYSIHTFVLAWFLALGRL